jgi:uncharacterized membrane protein (DUF106 family)
MEVLLKIILSVLGIALGCTVFFVYSEYKKFRRSIENEGASLMEKFIIGAVTFSSVILVVAVIVIFILIIISELTVKLPF